MKVAANKSTRWASDFMNYSNIIRHDVGNGPGIRTSLFVSGCTNNCPGCFNPEAQDFNYGCELTDYGINIIVDCCKDNRVSGLSILGGDPLCQSVDDMAKLTHLCSQVRYYGKTVWLWTGLVWEDVFNSDDVVGAHRQSLLSCCDVVVDGPFIEERKSLTLAWRGSDNQRIIDVEKTLNTGKIYTLELDKNAVQ